MDSARASSDRERIPVGRERSRPPRPVEAITLPATASGAGTALIAVLAVFVVLGIEVGRWVDAPVAGGIVGGFLGAVAGFGAVYLRFR